MTPARRTRSPEPIKLPDGVRHGTPQGYSNLCGCDPCLKAMNAANAKRKKARLATPATVPTPMIAVQVDAEPDAPAAVQAEVTWRLLP